VTLKIDFKKSRGKNKQVNDIQHSLNYKMSTIVKKFFSHFINTLNLHNNDQSQMSTIVEASETEDA
jgi:hypothetical protein